MMPHTNPDLLKHQPEAYRYPNAHERAAMELQRKALRKKAAATMSWAQSMFERLGLRAKERNAAGIE